MSDDILDYPSNSRIAARLAFTPGDTVPVGFILVRDLHNRVHRKIELSGYQGDTWLDLTNDVVQLQGGFVEAELIRTAGNGPWRATLHLRATSAGKTAEAMDIRRGRYNHIGSSVLFRKRDVSR